MFNVSQVFNKCIRKMLIVQLVVYLNFHLISEDRFSDYMYNLNFFPT